MSQMLTTLLPQFNIDSAENTYPRLVGILFLSLGLARLYGGIYIEEKGVLTISMWSWVIELVFVITEFFYRQFVVTENFATLILAPLMLAWSLLYYRRFFKESTV